MQPGGPVYNNPVMSQTVCQFIFFRVKPSVKPEDPYNEEGEALMNVFRLTKHQSGHQNSAWGRAAEDQDTIVWVVGEYCSLLFHRSLCPHVQSSPYNYGLHEQYPIDKTTDKLDRLDRCPQFN